MLKAVVVDGRKPGDLEGELARRAPAISSLLRRAKLSLRRATLRVVLEEDAPADCRRAAGDLPESVAVQMEDVSRSRGMAHIRTCDRCRAAWGRFARSARRPPSQLPSTRPAPSSHGTAEVAKPLTSVSV